MRAGDMHMHMHMHTLETCETCACARCTRFLYLLLQKYEVYKRKKAVLPTILHGLRGWIAVRR